MKLRQSVIDQTMADRARNLAAKATTPTTPWGKGQVSTLADIATRAMAGSYNISDIRYMAMALLQMNDTLGELKERVRRLEAGE